VAALLDTTVAAANSALQRARATVDADLTVAPRATAAGPADRELLRRYVDAWERGDVDGIVALLREDAVLRMPPQPSVRGAAGIGAFFARGCRTGAGLGTVTVRGTRANGRLGVVMHRYGAAGALAPHGVLLFDTDGGRITGLDAYIDPALPGLFEGC
jgi:RNA polymerase sigma-70 factor (ECF subfamily)